MVSLILAKPHMSIWYREKLVRKQQRCNDVTVYMAFIRILPSSVDCHGWLMSGEVLPRMGRDIREAQDM